MGDFIDDVPWDRDWDQHPREPRPFPSPTDPKVWVSADGEYHNVCDMSTSHLVNTIAFLWRRGVLAELGMLPPAAEPAKIIAQAKAKLPLMRAELERRAKRRQECN